MRLARQVPFGAQVATAGLLYRSTLAFTEAHRRLQEVAHPGLVTAELSLHTARATLVAHRFPRVAVLPLLVPTRTQARARDMAPRLRTMMVRTMVVRGTVARRHQTAFVELAELAHTADPGQVEFTWQCPSW